MRRVAMAFALLAALATPAWPQSAAPAPITVTPAPGGGLTVGGPISGSCANGLVLFSNNGLLGCEALAGGGNVLSSGTPANGQLAQWINATTVQGLTTGTGVATALGVNVGSAGSFGTVGTSGATVGLLNGNLTFSGNDTFSGSLTFSGLATGTQASCLGLTSGNLLALSTGACGTGTVTSASVVSANGFAGTVATAATTPAITLTTTVTGLLKGNGTAISAAAAGTDYLAPTGSGAALTGLTYSQIGSTPTTLAGYGITNGCSTAGCTLVSGTVTNVPTPSASTDAANKSYVDAVAAALNPAIAVQAATTQASDTSSFTYLNGASGIGATLTGPVNTAFVLDGFTFTAVGQRGLIKNDTVSVSGSHNGIYSITQIQTGILPVILTRVLDYDQPGDINNTGAIPVVNGTANALTSWLLSSAVATVGTDPLTFQKFSVNPATPATLGTGTSVSLVGPRQYFVCTGTCTVTPPVPAAGLEFCVLNGDNVATVITMAALGSGARYENTARTAYGTAGTGTFVSGGAAGDKACLLGLDSTHYLTPSFAGTWTAN
jgi:hypothetical protein